MNEHESDYPLTSSQLSASDQLKLEQIKHPRKRLEFLSARAAFNALGLNMRALSYTLQGKPQYEGKSVSLSHNHMYGAAIAHDSSAVGIDVEALTRRTDRIRHKFIHPSEEDIATEFGDLFLWVAKEAAYKMYGRKQLDFLDDLRIQRDEYGQMWAVVKYEEAHMRGRLFHVRGQETLMCWCVEKTK